MSRDVRARIIRGTLTPLVLAALSGGPLHGYAIVGWIQRRSDSLLQVDEGVLYPTLHRLESDGLLAAHWGRNDTGRRAKFYTLTESGRVRLREEVSHWRRSSDAVNAVLDAIEV